MHEPSGPELLKVERRAAPSPRPGQVLVRVEAFGLNRSELFTRLGHSPGVTAIEAVGTIAAAPGGEFKHGYRGTRWP